MVLAVSPFCSAVVLLNVQYGRRILICDMVLLLLMTLMDNCINVNRLFLIFDVV